MSIPRTAIVLQEEQRHLPRHPIIIMQDGRAPVVADLRHVIDVDKTLGNIFAACLTAGLPYVAEGPEDPLTAVFSLAHRDAPHHMGGRNIMDVAYSGFITAYDLPAISADELLASMIGCPLVDLNIVNWLSAFVEAYDALED